jgi:hypothetical protein
MEIKYLSDITVAPVIYPEDAYMETPPPLYTLHDNQYCFISTSWAVNTQIKTGKNILIDQNALNQDGKRCTWGNYFDYDVLISPNEVKPHPFWKLNYYGVMDSVTYTYDGHTYLLGIMHAENKNERVQNHYYKNSVKPSDTKYSSDEYSGCYDNGEYHDNWENYFAFLGITFIEVGVDPVENLMKNDIGPVIWSDEPYLDKREKKICGGLRHPSALIHGDYLYLYYIDESKHKYGHRVARAKLAHPKELVFFKLTESGFDLPALPKDFNNEDKQFLKIGTGFSRKLFALNDVLIRFSVAHVKNTDMFLGVGEFIQKGSVWTELFSSKNLIEWNSMGKIRGTEGKRWYEGVLHYPMFYNEACNSSNEIDSNCFYIVGTYHYQQSKPSLQYIKMSLL